MATGTGSPTFAERVPVEYRDKPYFQELLKNADPEAELLKQFDNLQQMRGKPKIGVPAADAPPEEWEKFYALTRPEAADKYELADPDFGEDTATLELVKNARDPEFIKAMQAAAFEEGVSLKQFQKIARTYEQVTGEVLKANQEAAAALEAKFEESAKGLFGGDMDKTLAYAQTFMTEHLTPEAKAKLGTMSNETLLALAMVGKSVHAKYEKEDTTTAGTATTGPASREEAIAEYERLIAEAGKLPRHSKEREAKNQEAYKMRDLAVEYGKKK